MLNCSLSPRTQVNQVVAQREAGGEAIPGLPALKSEDDIITALTLNDVQVEAPEVAGASANANGNNSSGSASSSKP
jgi:hypothetical protein